VSYCRWSSDDFACDLYVYADSAGGWTVHVAGNRVVGDIPPMLWPVDGDRSPEAIERFVASSNAQTAFVMTAKRQPIGLAHDGQTFHIADPAECADLVDRLIAMGYRAPAHVAEALRQEIEA
jgi:hypothetical protein